MIFTTQFEKKALKKSVKGAQGAVYYMRQNGEEQQEQVPFVLKLNDVFFDLK